MPGGGFAARWAGRMLRREVPGRLWRGLVDRWMARLSRQAVRARLPQCQSRGAGLSVEPKGKAAASSAASMTDRAPAPQVSRGRRPSRSTASQRAPACKRNVATSASNASSLESSGELRLARMLPAQ